MTASSRVQSRCRAAAADETVLSRAPARAMASAAILPILSAAPVGVEKHGPGGTAPGSLTISSTNLSRIAASTSASGLTNARKGCDATLAARLQAAPNPTLPPASM